MDFRTYYSKLFEATSKRKPVDILKVCWSTAVDSLFDLRYGVSTFKSISNAQLATQEPHFLESVGYQPTRALPFRKLMKALRLDKKICFVDFGCGKGRALMLAAEYGFNKVKGIEFAESLCQDAKENLETLKKIKSLNFDYEIIPSDVLKYALLEEDRILYLYDPFSEEILKKWIELIIPTLKRQGHLVTIIYHNNFLADQTLFDKYPKIFQKVQMIQATGNLFHIYQSVQSTY